MLLLKEKERKNHDYFCCLFLEGTCYTQIDFYLHYSSPVFTGCNIEDVLSFGGRERDKKRAPLSESDKKLDCYWLWRAGKTPSCDTIYLAIGGSPERTDYERNRPLPPEPERRENRKERKERERKVLH